MSETSEIASVDGFELREGLRALRERHDELRGRL